MNYLHMQNQFCNQKNFSDHPIQTAIRAELIGSDCCSALGITARGTTPVLALCRRLVEAKHDPVTPLEARRGDVLCLRIRSIGEAAVLELNGEGTGFRRRSQPDAASPVRQNEVACTHHSLGGVTP